MSAHHIVMYFAPSAEFGGQAISEKQSKSLISQAQSLIDQASGVAASF